MAQKTDETLNQASCQTAISGSSIQMNTFRQELIDLYMQGWLDRDWKIGEDEADEKAEMYADQIMKKYKL
jgi:hypothetical protein